MHMGWKTHPETCGWWNESSNFQKTQTLKHIFKHKPRIQKKHNTCFLGPSNQEETPHLFPWPFEYKETQQLFLFLFQI